MKIKHLLLIGGTILSCMTASAQQTTSPYSMYGYGLIGDRATSMQRQMGGVGYAMNSGRQINAMNPASYARIDSLTFLWDMGADIAFTWRKDGLNKEKVTGGGLDYITMQFPICKFMGGSVGLLPYSSVGYSFGDEIRHGTLTNQGSGGINEVYVGVSGRWKGASLGINVSYDFGNIQNDVFAAPTDYNNTLFEQIIQVRDWNILIGAQYTFKVDALNDITLGLTYSPKKSMRGRTWATIQETTSQTVPDTVASGRMKGNYYTPNSVGAGISWKRERASRIIAEVDFTWQQWSKAPFSPLYSDSNPDVMVFQGMNFFDRVKLAAGVEYVPRVRGNYFQRMAYRFGAWYGRDYLNIQGNSLRDYGLSCGFGFHTPQDKTMINLGLEWRHRQGHPSPMVKEDYLTVTLGLNFNELWFWQRKIR